MEKKLDFTVEIPGDFDENEFLDEMVTIVEKRKGKIAGWIINIPDTKRNRIVDAIKNLFFEIRW
jgi:hypothetical protein